ncbi:hypothetical protein C7N43_26130 [Sphingobacteriales bacterium UPWRP_1]|nr:hypothetical protein B6N25_16055 [Sphingobacteriales bacterium TSM_CSS]PSJ74006.1 hypothetical protein C7N43_26130 [Sphingobacteriales bacterium UPWRP_1]
MFTPKALPHPLVTMRQNDRLPEVFDLELNYLDEVKQYYHSVECHLVLYPYSRKITSEKFQFYPFEEYVRDIATHQRSVYTPVNDKMNKGFGLIFGILIALIFARFKPDDLFSVESIVSVFGAYLLGKDLWTDIDHFLINATKNFKLRYTDSYYFYELVRNTTLTQYSYFARKERYGKQHLLPQKLDFIEHSNSQTVRMLFEVKDWTPVTGASAHIMSIRVSPKHLTTLLQEGFMLGMKMSFNRRNRFTTRHFEVFQSLHRQQPGCIDDNGNWNNHHFFYRQTISAGRLKYFASSGIIQNSPLIELKLL